MTAPAVVAPGGVLRAADASADSADAGQRPLTVVQVGMGWLPWHGGGGVERYFHGLVEALPGAGVRVRAVVQGAPPTGAAGAAGGGGCELTSAATGGDSAVRRMLGVRRSVARAVEGGPAGGPPAELVASHFALYGLAAHAALRPAGRRVPHVVHFHGPWAAESAVEGGGRLSVAAKRVVEATAYASAARLLTASRAFADLLVRDYRVRPDRVRVVGAGVDVDRFDVPFSRLEARRRLGWPTDRPIVLAVRRLVRRMGLENLIRAMGEAKAAIPDVLVYIAGSGPLAPELRERAVTSGVGDQVRLLGYLSESDLPSAYRAADLSVLPSAALEGFGLSAAESLAAGTPALVTPVGGLPEVVSDLNPALVCDGHSIGALADRLVQLLTGRTVAPAADACRWFASRRFAWPVVAARVRAAYEGPFDD